MSEKLFHRRRWETPPRLASCTGTSPDTIRAAIKRGELEAHQFGTSKRPSYRVSLEAWQAYLKKKSTFQAQDAPSQRSHRRGRTIVTGKEYV